MIRRFLKWIFKKEYAEAMVLVEQARSLPARYVKYESYSMKSLQFLDPLQSIIKNVYFKFWLLERRANYFEAIKYGDLTNREMNIGRAMAIDELLNVDCMNFEKDYRELIEEQARDAKIQPK